MAIQIELPIKTDNLVTLTPAAIKQVRYNLTRAGKSGAFLRLAVKGGGCSGLSYVMAIADEANANDHHFEVDGIQIVVDPKSARFLSGVVLDYSLANMLEGGWVWTNPNAAKSCGCGTSFTPR